MESTPCSGYWRDEANKLGSERCPLPIPRCPTLKSFQDKVCPVVRFTATHRRKRDFANIVRESGSDESKILATSIGSPEWLVITAA